MGDVTRGGAGAAGEIRLAVICGMAAEADALGAWRDHPRISVAVSGARPDAAEAETARLLAEGCSLAVSFGVAGGLDPARRPGDPLICAHVVELGLGRDGPPPVPPSGAAAAPFLLGSDEVILDPADKARLFRETGAAAVDMETHRVARAATARGRRWLALRAVGDPAERALPALAADALDAAGRPRIGRVVLRLVARPGQLPAMLQVKRDTDAALRTLRRLADEELPRLLGQTAERRAPESFGAAPDAV